jgi:hypothetical protein
LPALTIEAASPDLEKQSFLAVGFLSREYSGKRVKTPKKLYKYSN